MKTLKLLNNNRSKLHQTVGNNADAISDVVLLVMTIYYTLTDVLF